jgi:hypothetical protein
MQVEHYLPLLEVFLFSLRKQSHRIEPSVVSSPSMAKVLEIAVGSKETSVVFLLAML